MKVLLTGGGTGGHITPLLAVAQKLKQLDPDVQVVYVGERSSKFAGMLADQPAFDQQYRIFAGKFRRYHGESWLRRLLDIRTNCLNLRDIFLVAAGTIQSWFLLRRLRPDVILLKGGFVGVPVGLSARRRYKLITHDSDVLPGLANRLVGRWAVRHATGQLTRFYSYPKDSMVYTGVLVAGDYVPVDTQLQHQYKAELRIPDDAQLLFITGGSLGAQAINRAMARIVPDLLQKHPKLHVIHQTGQGKTDCYGPFRDDRLEVVDLVHSLYRYSGAADVIVTRAGANTIAEFGVQGKAVIVVPNPLLTGGHQLKNAQYLEQNQAALVINENQLGQGGELEAAVEELLSHSKRRQELSANLQAITPSQGADTLAKLILEVGGPPPSSGESF